MAKHNSTELNDLDPAARVLVRFHWHISQVGDVRATVITTPQELADSYGQRVRFGDILGKHSEVEGVLQPSDFTFITADGEFIKKYEEYFGASEGHDPLAKLRGY